MQMHGGLLRRKKLQPELRNINAEESIVKSKRFFFPEKHVLKERFSVIVIVAE